MNILNHLSRALTFTAVREGFKEAKSQYKENVYDSDSTFRKTFGRFRLPGSEKQALTKFRELVNVWETEYTLPSLQKRSSQFQRKFQEDLQDMNSLSEQISRNFPEIASESEIYWERVREFVIQKLLK
jgi:hypothetical protein